MNIIEGNILNAKENIIAHQTNCKGVMGSGVAKYIRDKYPEVYQEYKKHCGIKDKKTLLGTVQFCKADDGKIIANLFGQYSFGIYKKQTDYDALRKSLEQLYLYAKENNLTIAFPYKIGCGNGGGKWEIVEKMISDIFKDYPYTFYKYNP